MIMRNVMAYLLLLDALVHRPSEECVPWCTGPWKSVRPGAQALGRERVFRERADILAETDEWLLSRFRLPQAVVLNICDLLEPQVTRETHRSNPNTQR